MIRFIKRSFSFVVTVVILLVSIDLFLPYFWGSQGMRAKMSMIQKQTKNEIDLVFIGSSRTYRHIDCQQFDSLNNHVTNSFNLGVPGTYSIESYYLLDNIITDQHFDNLKKVYIELQPIVELGNVNIHKAKSNYFVNQKWLTHLTNYFNWSDRKAENKDIAIKNYRVAWFENLFKIGMINNYLDYRLSQKLNPYMYIGKNQNGFYSCETQMADSGVYNNYRVRTQQFQSDTTVLTERISLAFTAYQNQKQPTESAKKHLSIIKELIAKLEAVDIKVKLFLPPKLPDSYEELIYISNELGDQYVIDLANPQTYPKLYQASYSFDVGHLNNAGASYFTSILAGDE